MTNRVDIGLGHRYSLWVYRGSYGGAIVDHPLHDNDTTCAWNGRCMGSIIFNFPETFDLKGARWSVENKKPLTLSPSLLCHCGDHGFIRNGLWVSA